MKYEKTLNIIYSNDFIMDELKDLFMEEADKLLPRLTGQDDEVLGQEYRAHMKAKEMIEDTFIHLRSMSKNESNGVGIKYK